MKGTPDLGQVESKIQVNSSYYSKISLGYMGTLTKIFIKVGIINNKGQLVIGVSTFEVELR